MMPVPALPASILSRMAVVVLTLAAWLNELAPVRAADLAIPAKFDMAGVFHHGVAPVKDGDNWGLMDQRGGWVVRPIHTEIGPGGDGLFAFLQDGRWGYMNASGAVRIKPIYDEAWPFAEGVAAVKSKGCLLYTSDAADE